VPAVLQKHILSRRFVTPARWRWPQNISCPDYLMRERQMTSLCGVSPILHRIKNREPEEHTGAVSGFAIPVQGIVILGEPQATERPSVPSPPTDDLRSGGNAPRRCRRRLTTLLKVTSPASNRLKGVVRRRRRRTGPGESDDGAASSRRGVREGEAARRNPWGVIFVQKIMSLSGACNAPAPLF